MPRENSDSNAFRKSAVSMVTTELSTITRVKVQLIIEGEENIDSLRRDLDTLEHGHILPSMSNTFMSILEGLRKTIY